MRNYEAQRPLLEEAKNTAKSQESVIKNLEAMIKDVLQS